MKCVGTLTSQGNSSTTRSEGSLPYFSGIGLFGNLKGQFLYLLNLDFPLSVYKLAAKNATAAFTFDLMRPSRTSYEEKTFTARFIEG
jgi:hypothetical protein